MIDVTSKKVVKKKAQVNKKDCVACGTCVRKCPVNAIKIISGLYAKADKDKCIGCGKCVFACPASVIEMV